MGYYKMKKTILIMLSMLVLVSAMVLSAEVNISSCEAGATFVSDTDYYLTADIVDASPIVPCLSATAVNLTNVLIDCQGHNISGAYDVISSEAIKLSWNNNYFANNITIQNCNIEGFGKSAIFTYAIDNLVIRNSKFINNIQGNSKTEQIDYEYVDEHINNGLLIENCTFYTNTTDTNVEHISVANTKNVIIRDNYFDGALDSASVYLMRFDIFNLTESVTNINIYDNEFLTIKKGIYFTRDNINDANYRGLNIYDNNFFGTISLGITIQGSQLFMVDGLRIYNNHFETFVSNSFPVTYLHYCNDTEVYNNTLKDITYGFDFGTGGGNIKVYDNDFSDAKGTFWQRFLDFENNNDVEVYGNSFNNASFITATGGGEMVHLYNVTNANVHHNNYSDFNFYANRVEGGENISFHDNYCTDPSNYASTCFQIQGGSNNVDIYDNTYNVSGSITQGTASYTAVLVTFEGSSTNTDIYNNQMIRSDIQPDSNAVNITLGVNYYGTTDASNINIYDNDFIDINAGVYFANTTDTSDISIYDNIMENNLAGVKLSGNQNNLNIFGNDMYGGNSGIYLDLGIGAITGLFNVTNNNLYDNIFAQVNSSVAINFSGNYYGDGNVSSGLGFCVIQPYSELNVEDYESYCCYDAWDLGCTYSVVAPHKPNITSPLNNLSEEYASLPDTKTITFSVIDDDTVSLSCSLYQNDTKTLTYPVTNNTPTSQFYLTISDYTTYSYYVNCTDLIFLNISDTYLYTAEEPETPIEAEYSPDYEADDIGSSLIDNIAKFFIEIGKYTLFIVLLLIVVLIFIFLTPNFILEKVFKK